MSDRPVPSSESTSIPLAARRHPLVHEILRGFRIACGGDDPGPVVLAVSGGRDSLALLLAAAVLREHDDVVILPRVVHVHHHLRPEADEEADHVLRVAAQLEVPAEVRHVEVPGRTPAEARLARYEALREAAMSCQASRVATGHHAEDQLETILAALGRGAGPMGLAGMPRHRELGDGVALIRPMLGVTRADAAELCQAADVSWCDDPGNVDPGTQRGRLRRDVLPVLEALWPGAASRAAATADVQALAATAMEGLVSSAFGSSEQRCWTRGALSSLPVPMIATGLRRAALDDGSLGPDGLSHQALLAAAEAIGDRRQHQRCFQLGAGMEIIVDAREIKLQRNQGVT